MNVIKDIYHLLTIEINCNFLSFKILYKKEHLIEIDTDILIDNKKLILNIKKDKNKLILSNNLNILLKQIHNLKRIVDNDVKIENDIIIFKYYEGKSNFFINLIKYYLYDILINISL